MYDMFVFRNEEFLYAPYERSDYCCIIVLAGQKQYVSGDDMIKLSSCFGAMAFYKRDTIKTCWYNSFRGDCECVVFYGCIIEKNHGRVFMNSSQMIRYNFAQ